MLLSTEVCSVGNFKNNFHIFGVVPKIWSSFYFWYLLKRETTWNDLKRFEMTYSDPQRAKNNLKRPTTTYNEQGTTEDNLQRARNNLKRPTTSKTQPTMTWTYLQRAKKKRETTNDRQIFRLLYNMGQMILFSNTLSTQHLVTVFRALLCRGSWWKQSVKNLLSCIKRQLSCAFFTGYKISFFLSGFHLSTERETLLFLAPLYHFHPLRKFFGLQRLHLSGSLNNEWGRCKWIQEPYYIFFNQNLYKGKQGGRVSGSAFECQLPAINYCCKTLSLN